MEWVAEVGRLATKLLAVPAMSVTQEQLDALRLDLETMMAEPTPATHAILTVLKAGETVCQTL